MQIHIIENISIKKTKKKTTLTFRVNEYLMFTEI